MASAVRHLFGARRDTAQQSDGAWTLCFRDEGAERGFVRARGASLAASARFTLAILCTSCCAIVALALLELAGATTCLDVRRARIGVYSGGGLLALILTVVLRTSSGLSILGAGTRRLEIVLVIIGMGFMPLCVSVQYRYMDSLLHGGPVCEIAGLSDDTQDCLVLVLMLVLQSVVHIILPIRWCVLWPMELAGVLCYTAVAIFWSPLNVNMRASFVMGLTVQVLLLALGKRNTERYERQTFTRVVQETTLRFEAEHKLDVALQEGPKRAEKPAKPDDLASSLPGTTFTGEVFQGMRWGDIVSLGGREHWLVPCTEVQVRLGQVVGTGGFGMVLPGVYHGARVALKAPKEAAQASSLLDIAQELRVFRLLRHPNIVLFYGACVDATTTEMLLVLEYVDGVRLEAFVGEPPGAPDTAVRCKLARDVCCALRYLHAQSPSIVHGDIKGSNVLVQGRGVDAIAKLVDFGLSRLVTKHAKPLGGTLAWMPPEVAQRGRPSPSADVFCFGRLLYLIVTGRRPLAGLDRGTIIEHARRGSVLPLFWPDSAPLLDECRRLCLACCQAEPTDRLSIFAVYAALQAWGVQRDTAGADESSSLEEVALEGNLRRLLERARRAISELGPLGGNQLPNRPAKQAEPAKSSTEVEEEEEEGGETKGGTAGSSSIETSDRTCLALPAFAATPAEMMDLTVVATISTWNAPVRRRGACCIFHGLVTELERVHARLAACPCKPEYLPHSDWQCPQCKLMGLVTSVTMDTGTLLRGDCSICGHVSEVLVSGGKVTNVLIPL